MAGSLRKATLFGTTYNVMTEGGVSGVGSGSENTLIPTTGGNILKMVGRAHIIEGLSLICTREEADELKSLSESNVSGDLALEDANGDTVRATGWIDYESYETEDAKATIKLLPEGPWTSFLS